MQTVLRQFLGTVVKNAKHIQVAPGYIFVISSKIWVLLFRSLKYVSPKYTFFGPRSNLGAQPDTTACIDNKGLLSIIKYTLFIIHWHHVSIIRHCPLSVINISLSIVHHSLSIIHWYLETLYPLKCFVHIFLSNYSGYQNNF